VSGRDTVATGRPRGIFRRETKGFSAAPVTVRVERGRVVTFARLLGETDPVCTDVAAARAQGHPDVVAPPSFPMVVEMLANEERSRQGEPNPTEVIGCDFHHLLHGEQHYIYEGLVFAGDEVTVGTTVLDFYDKRGGLLEFVVLESTIHHDDRGVLVRATRTLLHRLDR